AVPSAAGPAAPSAPFHRRHLIAAGHSAQPIPHSPRSVHPAGYPPTSRSTDVGQGFTAVHHLTRDERREHPDLVHGRRRDGGRVITEKYEDGLLPLLDTPTHDHQSIGYIVV